MSEKNIRKIIIGGTVDINPSGDYRILGQEPTEISLNCISGPPNPQKTGIIYEYVMKKQGKTSEGIVTGEKAEELLGFLPGIFGTTEIISYGLNSGTRIENFIKHISSLNEN